MRRVSKTLAFGAMIVLLMLAGFTCYAGEKAPYRFPEKDKKRNVSFTAFAKFKVSDYGAKGDGKSDDGPALRRALAALIAKGRSARLIFEKKTYRLGKRSDHGYNINLSGANKIMIEGNGATLVLHPDNSLLSIHQCKNIIVKDLTVDYNPLTWTQGTVLSVDKKAGSAEVRISDGFPMPDPAKLKQYGLYARMDPKTMATLRNHYAYPHYTNLTHIKQTGEGRYTFTFSNPKTCGDMKVGEGFVYMLAKGMHLNTIVESENVLYENMTIHATRYFGFAGGRCKGDLIFRKIRFTPKPGRYVSTLGDGLHFKGNEKGPMVEDCTFEGVWDDKLHFACMVDAVTQAHSKRKFTIRSTQGGNESPELKVGDKMLFYNYGKGTFLGSSKIIRIDAKHPKARHRTITVLNPIKGVIPAGDLGNKSGMGLNIAKFTVCYTERHSGKGAVIRRNKFDTFHRHPIILRTPEAVFEDNEIIGSGQSVGIKVGNSHIGEWPVPYNIEIKNNKLRDNLMMGMSISSFYSPRKTPGEGWTRNITIENNTLTNQYADAIRLDKVSNVWLKGNTVEMAPDADLKNLPYREDLCVAIHNADDFGAGLMKSIPPVLIQPRGEAVRKIKSGEDTGAVFRSVRDRINGEPVYSWFLHPPWKNGLKGAVGFEVPAKMDGFSGISFQARKGDPRGDGVVVTVEWKDAGSADTAYKTIYTGKVQKKEWSLHTVPLDTKATDVVLRFLIDCGPANDSSHDAAILADIRFNR